MRCENEKQWALPPLSLLLSTIDDIPLYGCRGRAAGRSRDDDTMGSVVKAIMNMNELDFGFVAAELLLARRQQSFPAKTN